ncbi:MAG: hypothetical protein J6O39_06770 [Treponema sp.]|nr:hypothetical protein [Treponema sp.]
MRLLTLILAAALSFSPCTGNIQPYPEFSHLQNTETTIKQGHTHSEECILTAKKNTGEEKISFQQFFINGTIHDTFFTGIKSSRLTQVKKTHSTSNRYISFLEFFQTVK